MSSYNLDKYEYLTGEDLGFKPSTVEQAKFEYSPLGKFFNKCLKEEEKKEGLLKRLKNVEDRNEEQLKAIEDQGNKQLNTIKIISTGSKPLKTISYFRQLSPETKELFERIKKEKNNIDPEKLVCAKSNNKMIFNFNKFKASLDIPSDIYRDKNLLKDAKKTNTMC